MFQRILSLLPFKRFRDPAPVVSVLRLQGVIGRMGPIGGGGLTLQGLEKTIEKAFAAKRLSAVALAVNSPGGSPVQSSLIAGRIRSLAEEKDVPVYAFVEDVAASGGYWLACAADKIYADENSIIGSIGVITSGFGFTDAIGKLGIERRVYSAGNHKSMLDPFRPEDPDDIARLTSIQRDIHDSFKSLVRERRGDRLQGSDAELFEGDIWSGRQAETIGLIDGIGDLQGVMKKHFGEKTKFRPVGQRTNPVKRLLGGREQAARDHILTGVAALEEWSAWKRYGL